MLFFDLDNFDISVANLKELYSKYEMNQRVLITFGYKQTMALNN